MKYRLLTHEEREPLREDFIKFLAVNGIDAESWVDLKTNQPDTATGILESFSDMIFETILRKQMFVEMWSDKSVHTFQFLKEKLVWVGLEFDESITQETFISIAKKGRGKIVHSSKSYTQSREEDMFAMLQKGALMSDGELFKTISLLMAH